MTPSLAWSQTFSNNGRFSIEFGRGCIPMTVDINELDTLGNVPRQYFYFEGANVTSSTSFTYDSVGIYQIVQILDGILADTLEVEVLESRVPEVLISKCSNLEISIESTDMYYDSIRVYFGGPDSITLVPNQITTYQFSTPGTQTYALKGFFKYADEVCQTFFEETIPLLEIITPTITAANVKETCKDNFALYLTLDQIQREVVYSVSLNQNESVNLYRGFLDSTFLLLRNIPFERTGFCIQLAVFDPCSDVSFQSNEICATPSPLSLSPFETLYSTYEGSTIYINLDQVASGFFEIERRFEGGNFESRETQTGSFNDPIGSASRKYFYRLNYIDSCGSLLSFSETHPPLIEIEKIRDNQFEVTYTPPENSLTTSATTEYTVGNEGSFSTNEVTASRFQLNLDATNGIPRQQFQIKSMYQSGPTLTSNTLSLKYELVIYVPNAFTPNGDGLNDTLEFFGVPTENAVVKIYSQWGQTVYESNDLSMGWNGIISGSLAPAGTYLYEILFETTEGKKLRQRGTFAIILN